MNKQFILRNIDLFVHKRITKMYLNKNENWAMITGCTSGIGKSFSDELAKIGFNLILVSRNNIKLENQASEIENKFKVKTKLFQFDFAKNILSDNTNYKKLEEDLKEINHINLLVNNVGEASVGPLTEFPVSHNTNLIKTNILSYVNLTQFFVEKNRDNHEKIGIINIGSYYGTRSLPGVIIYSSTKSFLNNFSIALSYEHPKIDILCVAPLWVRTKMTRAKKTFFVLEPRNVVIASLLKIGLVRFTYGNWKHSLLGILLKFVPDFIFCRLTLNYYNKIFLRIKNRIKS